MTDPERAVIEAAVEWAMWRVGSQYGPGAALLSSAAKALEEAVAALHAEHDGRWK